MDRILEHDREKWQPFSGNAGRVLVRGRFRGLRRRAPHRRLHEAAPGAGRGLRGRLGDQSLRFQVNKALGYALGLIAFAAAFILALVAQVPRDVQFPEVSMYASLALVKDPKNSIRVKYELTRSWLRDADANDRAGFAKRRLLNFSTALVGVGLAALTLNYTLAPSGEKPVPTVRVILEPTSLPTTHH